MQTDAIKAAISTIELQLEALKAACGLSKDVGEEHDEETDKEESTEHKMPAARRGRHLKLARFKQNEDE